jgi:FkbM family methyltransferase
MESSVRKLMNFGLTALALGRSPREKWEIFWRQTKNVRVRLGLARYHPEMIYRLPTRYGPLFLRDNFGDATNVPDLFYRNVYRPGRLVEEGVILDIGANIGLFAAWAAGHNPGKKIYCFEPLASNVRLIPMNCPSAIVSPMALGRNRARVRLGVDGHRIMASRFPTAWPTREEEFEVMPLDEFARENAIEQVAFMMIDAEGMELEILDGSRETLGKTCRVAMETHGGEVHRESIGRLRDAKLAIEVEEFSGATGIVIASRKIA